MRTIDAHDRDIDGAAVLPCGTRFISGSDDGTAKLWNIDGSLERTFRMVGAVALCQVRSVVAMPDGVHFVVGLSNGCLRLYHVDGTLAYAFEGHADFVYDLVLTPDGQHIISGSGDQLVKVWSVATKSLVSTCRGHTHSMLAVAAMPDGQRILSGSTRQHRPRVAPRRHPQEHLRAAHRHGDALVALPDNQHALSGSSGCGDRTVKLFNVNDGAVLRTFRHHTSS